MSVRDATAFLVMSTLSQWMSTQHSFCGHLGLLQFPVWKSLNCFQLHFCFVTGLKASCKKTCIQCQNNRITISLPLERDSALDGDPLPERNMGPCEKVMFLVMTLCHSVCPQEWGFPVFPTLANLHLPTGHPRTWSSPRHIQSCSLGIPSTPNMYTI